MISADTKGTQALITVNHAHRNTMDGLPDDVRQCLDYWESLRAGRFAPPWTAFDWDRISPAIIPHIGVVDVREDPVDFVYRFWGSAHTKMHDQEMTGNSVTEMCPAAESRSVFAQYAETLETRRPLLFENTIVPPTRGVPLRDISLHLLFSDDGEAITQLMAVSGARKDFASLRDLFSESA